MTRRTIIQSTFHVESPEHEARLNEPRAGRRAPNDKSDTHRGAGPLLLAGVAGLALLATPCGAQTTDGPSSRTTESTARAPGRSAGTQDTAQARPTAPVRESTPQARQPDGARTGDKSAIRPFRVEFPDSDLADLRRRIEATRWPEKELVPDGSQGVQLATMQKLAEYWASDYDWRTCEAKLNSLPQFITEIDGVDIHFIHVKSKHPNALPIVVTHGWPGSIIEQLKIIGPLTDPPAFGGKAEDAFDVVIPSIPGYGFSGKPTETGWDPPRIARAWVVLMDRLGYSKYVAQGGDWGTPITEEMALLTPAALVGIHTNMPSAVPPEIQKGLQTGTLPENLTDEEKHACQQLDFFYKKGLAYAQEMGNRPQTLYGLADSPIGLAAWILDHDARSYELIARVFDGKSEGLTRDDILDNITLYWLTNTGVSSARLYWENKIVFFAPRDIGIPVAVSAYPDELYQAPRSWVARAYPKLIHYNKLDKGGHFAAWEQPQSFSEELWVAFRPLR